MWPKCNPTNDHLAYKHDIILGKAGVSHATTIIVMHVPTAIHPCIITTAHGKPLTTGGISRAAIAERLYPIKKPRADVREEKKWGELFPGHEQVKAAIERHPAMLPHNHPDGCYPCQNCTARNPQTRRRCKETGALPPDQRYLCLELHPSHPPILRELKVPKSSICGPDMYIHLPLSLR